MKNGLGETANISPSVSNFVHNRKMKFQVLVCKLPKLEKREGESILKA